MDILFLLIPLSVLLVLLVAGALWHAIRSGQFDDLEGPGFKVLLDDDRPSEKGGEGTKSVDASKRLPP
ncbi:MAG: cbb3-type cytochrome oxidase assembly protein CcoS [Gammaproteobacteria bacterium]|nr:cbb3-type cytochrome oxidase assembly protein CcoS [Gammaproteobacteria bacterium]